MNSRVLAALLAPAFLAGCVSSPHSPITSPGNDPLSGPSSQNFTADWRGDLFLRFELHAKMGTSCTILHEATGQFVAPGDYFLASVQEGAGETAGWHHREFNSNVDPSASGTLAGQEVETGERRLPDHWAIRESPHYDVPNQGLILTFIARNLQPWPESPGPQDFGDMDNVNRSHTWHVSPTCDAPIHIANVEYGREVLFFNADSFNSSAAARLYGDRASGSDASIVSGGQLGRTMTAERVEVLASVDPAPGIEGTFTVRHPGGEKTWQFQPGDHAFDEAPMMHVISTSGEYELSLDWVGVHANILTGAIVGVTSIPAFPPST